MPGDFEYSDFYSQAITSAGGTVSQSPIDIKRTISQLGTLIGGGSPTQAVAAASNAGTVTPVAQLYTFTNTSAATMTITLATTSAYDGQKVTVRIYDFSAVAQTITWVNTENGGATAPTTSNGSTTLPKTTEFQYNGATSKWRCILAA